MTSPVNPFTGSSWNTAPATPTTVSQTPWLSAAPNTNPGGYSNPKGANEINRNMGLTNIASGQMKNQLAPFFAQLMQQYGGQAGDFFKNLMNLGSPYYQQKQLEGFQQGVQQNQNASAQAQEQLRAQGYGNTPSGANAAMIGGMNQAGSQSLAENYLQNLFQNELMQGMGAQGLTSLAGMFNPAQLLGGTSLGANVQAPPSFFQNMQSLLGGLGEFFGGASQGAQAGANIYNGGH